MVSKFLDGANFGVSQETIFVSWINVGRAPLAGESERREISRSEPSSS